MWHINHQTPIKKTQKKTIPLQTAEKTNKSKHDWQVMDVTSDLQEAGHLSFTHMDCPLSSAARFLTICVYERRDLEKQVNICYIYIKLQIFSEYFKMALSLFPLISSFCSETTMAIKTCSPASYVFETTSNNLRLESPMNQSNQQGLHLDIFPLARRVSLRKCEILGSLSYAGRRLKYLTSNPYLQFHDLAPLAWKTAGKPLSSWPEIQKKNGSLTAKNTEKRGLGLPRRSKRSARRSSARSRATRKVLRIWPKSQSSCWMNYSKQW